MAHSMKTREKAVSLDLGSWKPKTALGRKVKAKEVLDIDEILDSGQVILEPEIVDALLPDLAIDFLLIGQAKGKFGGGQRRVFRQTQKKTREGNKPKFTTMAVVGDRNGHVGIGLGSSKETMPAREKAIRKAKLNIFKLRRGTGSWADASSEPHSLPFAVEGKVGSVRIKLMPAPKGKGLVVEKEVAKVLELAGIQNAWSKSFGQTKNKVNFIKALERALRKLSVMRIQERHQKRLSILEGSAKQGEAGAPDPFVEEDDKERKERKPRRPVRRQRK